MPTKKKEQLIILANDLLPFLKKFDFNIVYPRDETIIFFENGWHYNIRIICFPPYDNHHLMVELRIHRYNYNPLQYRKRLFCGIHEQFFCYLQQQNRGTTTNNSIVFDKYFISDFRHTKEQPNWCFSCNKSICMDNSATSFKNHLNTPTHNAKQKNLIIELSKTSILDENCVKEIFSFL